MCRVPSQIDRRSVRVRLTDQGSGLAQKILDAVRGRHRPDAGISFQQTTARPSMDCSVASWATELGGHRRLGNVAGRCASLDEVARTAADRDFRRSRGPTREHLRHANGARCRRSSGDRAMLLTLVPHSTWSPLQTSPRQLPAELPDEPRASVPAVSQPSSSRAMSAKNSPRSQGRGRRSARRRCGPAASVSSSVW